MAVSYGEAVKMLQEEAQFHRAEMKSRTEQVPLQVGMNRLCADTLCVSWSTPSWDTSALDGYALSSRETKIASAANTIRACDLSEVW